MLFETSMPLQELVELVAPEYQQFNQIITQNITKEVGLAKSIIDHILAAGGKRIRPLTLLLVSRACGYQGDQHILSAVAVEYFHNATLLHDDVVDDSTTRRGQAAAHAIWGGKGSILVGDILLTQAVQLMIETGDMAKLSVLVNAAEIMTRAEVKQLQSSHQGILSVEEYLSVIEAKTAFLFAASAEIGALFADHGASTVTAMHQFGKHLGVAFQIIDDLLDYDADESLTGKRVGDDLRDGKVTLPMIYAHRAASSQQAQMLEDCVHRGDDSKLGEIIQLMRESGAFADTQQFANQQAEKARACLSVLPDSSFRYALEKLLTFVVQRQH